MKDINLFINESPESRNSSISPENDRAWQIIKDHLFSGDGEPQEILETVIRLCASSLKQKNFENKFGADDLIKYANEILKHTDNN